MLKKYQMKTSTAQRWLLGCMISGLTVFSAACEKESIFDPIIEDPIDTIIDSIIYGSDSIPEGWQQVGDLLTENMIWGLTTDPAGNVYASGWIDELGRREVMKWNGSVWEELNLHANAEVYALTADAMGNIYAVGAFTNATLPSAGENYVAKWNGSSWLDIGGGGGTSLSADGVGNVYKNNWKYDGTSWSILCPVCTLSTYETNVHIANEAGTQVYAGGSQQDADGFRYVSVCTGDCWEIVGAPFANANIYALALDPEGNIYAAGSFTNGYFSSEGSKYVAKWDGNTWSELGNLNADCYNNINYMVYDDVNNKLYASGSFYRSATDYFTIAEWDGSSWTELGSMALDPAVITVDNSGNLYAVFAQLQGDGSVGFMVLRKE
jgi:hypothetical protein